MGTKIIKLWYRIYSDFLMPSRLEEYRALLEEVLKRNYEINSISDFWKKIKNHSVDPRKKYLILRHDVDTDIDTAKEMWEIERDLNINSSYFFRLSTLDIPFMRKIEEQGGEASYHYEEVAYLAKKEGLSREQIFSNLPYIKKLFKSNLEYLRNKTNLPMKIVASHGDFVNRMLDIPNTIILNDYNFRKEIDIELEVNDTSFMNYVTSRYSDTHYPIFWKPHNPIESIRNNEHVIYILVHPRHWRTNVVINAVDDITRLNEAICYSFRVKRNLILRNLDVKL